MAGKGKKPKSPFEDQLSYKIELPAIGTRESYFVSFVDGVGILNPDALRAARPGWFHGAEQVSGAPISEYVAYWKRHGAKVTKIDAAEAEEIRGKLQTELKKRADAALKNIREAAKPARRAAPVSAAPHEKPAAEETFEPEAGPPAEEAVEVEGPGENPPEAKQSPAAPHEETGDK